VTFAATPGTVYFVGAGPGAPDLMTLRGRALIEAADLVLFADSLVDPAHTEPARPGAQIIGTSSLTLEEIVRLMVDAARGGQVVVRLQSGDPTIFGAIHEQLAALADAAVPAVVVPGVTSATAAAASLGIELTVPGIAQTVILARASGRASPVPERESLRALAAHGATLALFLSAALIEAAVRDLVAGGYAEDTPAAIAYRVSWPDEQLIRCALAEVPARMTALGISRTALVIVGPAVGAEQAGRSRLYDGDYSHRYRQGTP
jgi:precorrin-4/cobalt-precorrin-4 C11-methyltransferase